MRAAARGAQAVEVGERGGEGGRGDAGGAQRIAVPVIPDMAVLQRTDGAVVFTLDPTTNRVERRVIEIGGFQVGKIEVAKGLLPGELVLTKGHPALVDGVLVRRSMPEQGPPSVAAQPRGFLQEADEVSVQ